MKTNLKDNTFKRRKMYEFLEPNEMKGSTPKKTKMCVYLINST